MDWFVTVVIITGIIAIVGIGYGLFHANDSFVAVCKAHNLTLLRLEYQHAQCINDNTGQTYYYPVGG